MPVKASRKTPPRGRPLSYHREVLSRTARHFLLTFITGAVLGGVLALLSFAYLPLIQQTRRLPVYSDPYSVFLRNSSSDPWSEFDSDQPDYKKRIFCLVLTLAAKQRLDLLNAVRDTWTGDLRRAQICHGSPTTDWVPVVCTGLGGESQPIYIISGTVRRAQDSPLVCAVFRRGVRLLPSCPRHRVRGDVQPARARVASRRQPAGRLGAGDAELRARGGSGGTSGWQGGARSL